jgi:hypothetical protein
VIDDRVEAYLGQRVAQLGRGTVERPGVAREIGPEIERRQLCRLAPDPNSAGALGPHAARFSGANLWPA